MAGTGQFCYADGDPLNANFNYYDMNPEGSYCATYSQFFGQMGVSMSMWMCGELTSCREPNRDGDIACVACV